jgi:hypothetical protein
MKKVAYIVDTRAIDIKLRSLVLFLSHCCNVSLVALAAGACRVAIIVR